MSEPSIYELHDWIDLCDDPDKATREKAQKIVKAWERNVQPGQIWSMDNKGDAICTVLSIHKKIKVEIKTFNPAEGEKESIAYFGRKSFLNRWSRML
jgi:hypothetical protein